MTPRVSILLPVWNDEATLGTTLTSLVRQTLQDWECVLVDDGSIDDSRAIARHFARTDERFRLIDRPHEGLVPSLNAGLTACRAPFVARMDADDWMHRQRLARQTEMLEARPELDAVGCFVRIFPRRSMREGRRSYESWLNSLHDAEAVWRERFIECPVAHPALMVRRSRLATLGYRDRAWPEDYDLLLRILRDGPKVGTVPARLLGWRDRPDRLSRTDTRYAQSSFTRCRAWHLHRDFLGDRAEYVLWGHGRTGRALRRALSELGHRPAAIVEVHPRRIGNTIHGAPVVPPEWLAERPPYPLVVSVAGRDPRGEIRSMLAGMRFREGFDYVCAA